VENLKGELKMKKDWMIKESELDDDQIKVLMATLDKSCIVAGCAGSGKSVLALIKAQRVQKAYGNNYQVIVFTKALCHYMNAGRIELGLNNDFCYHWDWVNKRKAPHSDYIIVDEIQDFTEDEIKQFISSADKNFYFFGDTAQSIYEGLKTTMPVGDIRSITPAEKRAKDFELYRNYRLPIPVARVAHVVGVDLDVFLESTYKSCESAMPRFLGYATKDAQIEAIDRIIKKNQMTDVAILLPHNEEVKAVYDKLSKMGNYEVRFSGKGSNASRQDTLDFASTNPKIMTYHSAKGLQFETVFLPYVEDFSEEKPSNRKALYVAMTRTYRNLYVMHNNCLPAVLKQVDAQLYKTSEDDAGEVMDI